MNRPKPSLFHVGDRVALRGTGIKDAEVVRVLPKRLIVRIQRGATRWTENLGKAQVRRLPA